jgi:hypothetical protein
MKRRFLLVILLITLLMNFIGKPSFAAGPNIILELLLNEGSGEIAHDSSGYDNNANIIGADWVRLPTGKWALSFNGSNDSLVGSYSESLDFSGTNAKLTVEVWVSMSQDKSSMWLGTASGGSKGGYALYYHQPLSKISGYIESPTGWQGEPYDINPYGVNIWHHVVYTYDGQVGKIYIDGIEKNSCLWPGGIFPSLEPFRVYSGFAGMIGKIAVYNNALSSNQIKNNYQIERGNYYQNPTKATIYVYPAITDNKTYSTVAIPNYNISNNIVITGAPGEYRPASFIIYTPNSISSVIAKISDLSGLEGTISYAFVDLRVVKEWYQAGLDIWDTNHKVLTPELLLKNDSLVKVENGQNYVKLTDGTYKWISDPKMNIPTPSVNQMPIQDTTILQPVNISGGTSKQFWITLRIPENANAGTYTGTIKLSTSGEIIGEVQINLEVLPIKLLEPCMTYSIAYAGILESNQPQGTISSSIKSETQYMKEMEDLAAHGITNPAIYQSFDATLLNKVISIRNTAGLVNQPFYYLGLQPWGYQSVDKVKQVINFAHSNGIADVFFYGQDEADGDALKAQRSSWRAIKDAGGKIFVAGNKTDQHLTGNFAMVGDIQDLLICAGGPSAAEAAQWHSVGHQIFNYANPQCGEEKPETYRRNYGLLLWQNNYDGAMDFAYQWGFGNIWNDFDNPTYRDHVMAYPTLNGVIDTIQWEGFREGVNDVRYLTTLLDMIKKAKANGKDVSSAEAWLVSLKNSDLTKLDLDTVRSNMINYILSLQAQETPLEYINVTPSNFSVNAGGSQIYTAQGYDINNKPIYGLIYSWNVTLPGVGSIDSNGLFTAGTELGSFSNVIRATARYVFGSASLTITESNPSLDINQDGHTNVQEMIIIGQHMGETGSPGWIPEDVNDDGVISVLDNIAIGQHWTG